MVSQASISRPNSEFETHRAWPNLDYSTVAGALVLSSSPPRIAPSPLRLVDAE